MAWSTLDLSSITDDLIAMITNCVAAWPLWSDNGGTITPFNISITGSMPESVRQEDGCQVSLYMLHVGADRSYRNTPANGPVAQPNRRQPLALDLYYLLTAFAGKNSHQEQQAMTIALRCFHEHPIVKSATEEYSLTMEMETADEIARLWQGLATPLRLSAIFKVSVAFITPSETPPAPAAPPVKLGLAVTPADLGAGAPAALNGTLITVTFHVPPGTTRDDLDPITTTVGPQVARAGDQVMAAGSGLDQAAFASIYLRPVGGAEVDVSAWRVPPLAPNDVRLRLPATVGPPPANTPDPGVYLVAVGSDSPAVVRSNVVPLCIAARIDNVATPPRLLPDAGGFYTIQGVGFTPGLTEVILGTIPLARVAGTPGPGEFQADPSGTSLRLQAPSPLSPGRYYVRVRVNQIDSPAAWYIEL